MGSTRKGATSTFEPACTPFELPVGGVLVFNDSYTSTLASKVIFRQPCDGSSSGNLDPGPTGNSTVVDGRDPFYASTSPQIFAIATATVISYLLVIIIFITPRTFYNGAPGGGSGNAYLGRGANAAIIGVGRRPWLQKIATVTVAISLTIATADTFHVAADQYEQGFTDAGLLVDKVVGSTEIRAVRVISDTFLWLAQVQTLIRLFPRHKEKVTIKWLGFALVSLDTIFTIIDDFVDRSTRVRPRSFQDAIPALNYLFELAISLIYSSCVIYYSLSKRRFAFWHPRMRNICLVALLSYIAILIPVVFFVLDVSKPNVAGWGDYIRWVGAAAASVVVWEWVERIEALERDERKDGILGREIFDGDEMLDATSSDDGDWPGRRQYWNRNGYPTEEPGSGNGRGGGGGGRSRMTALRSRIPFGHRHTNEEQTPVTNADVVASGAILVDNRDSHPAGQPAVPPQAATPISRSDTTSAASTIYAIRYHTVNTPTPAPAAPPVPESQRPTETAVVVAEQDEIIVPKEIVDSSDSATTATDPQVAIHVAEPVPGRTTTENNGTHIWKSVHNPFKRRRASPPAEVAGAQIASGGARRSPIDRTIHLRNRLTAFASSRRSGPLGSNRTGPEELPMAVTVIPAQKRSNRTWSPGTQIVPDPGVEAGGHPLGTSARKNQSPARGSDGEDGDEEDMPVMIIPAPRRGQRTWSPEDAFQGHVQGGQTPEPEPPDRRSTISPPSDMMSAALFSTRGSLTISEGQARSPATSRRSTYTRPSPVSVAGSQQRSTPPIVASPSLGRVLEHDHDQDQDQQYSHESSPATLGGEGAVLTTVSNASSPAPLTGDAEQTTSKRTAGPDSGPYPQG